MFHRLVPLLVTVTVVCHLASCIGSSASGACERVSVGVSTLTVQNALSSGLEAYLPQFAFGADMAAGECNIIGLDYSAASLDVRLELQQCTNSPGDTDCGNKTFGATKVQTIPLPRGESRTVTVDAAAFR